MAKLRLRAPNNDKPVKVTVEIASNRSQGSRRLCEILARESGQSARDPAKLIAPMLARFVATDRAFARLRKAYHGATGAEG